MKLDEVLEPKLPEILKKRLTALCDTDEGHEFLNDHGSRGDQIVAQKRVAQVDVDDSGDAYKLSIRQYVDGDRDVMDDPDEFDATDVIRTCFVNIQGFKKFILNKQQEHGASLAETIEKLTLEELDPLITGWESQVDSTVDEDEEDGTRGDREED